MSAKIPIPLRDVGCQDLIIHSQIVHHGNLRRRWMLNNLAERVNVKQLSKVIRWRQSYVVLHGGCLYIYANETSVRPLRATSLYGFTGIEHCNQEVPKDISWPFKLVCALQEKDRTYYFSAPSEKDLKVWINFIQEEMNAIFRANERSIPTALVSPHSHSARAGNVSRPPVPPREAEYVLKEDDEDDDSPNDYTEIDDEDLDVMTSRRVLNAQNASAINSRLPAIPANSQPQPATKKVQPTPTAPAIVGRVAPTPVAPRIAPKPKLPSADTGSRSGDSDPIRPEDKVEYFSAPHYLDLSREEDLELRKAGIPLDAYWKGKPDDADELMKKLTHNGAYMLRDSSEKGAQTLIVRFDSNVVKYKLHVNEKSHIGLMASGLHFETIASLVNFYKSNNIPRYDLPLTIPYSQVQKT